MLPPGHIAVSYILVKSAELAGDKISGLETLLVLVASIILDLDLIPAARHKKSHHEQLTHTPFGALIIWLALIFLTGNYLSNPAKILILSSFLLHLVSDEVGVWFSMAGLQKIAEKQKLVEINWLFPITKFRNHQNPEILRFSKIVNYIKKYQVSAAAEIVLMVFALLIFLFNL